MACQAEDVGLNLGSHLQFFSEIMSKLHLQFVTIFTVKEKHRVPFCEAIQWSVSSQFGLGVIIPTGDPYPTVERL